MWPLFNLPVAVKLKRFADALCVLILPICFGSFRFVFVISLLGAEHHGHVTTVQQGSLVDGDDVSAACGETLQQLLAYLGVSHLTPKEAYDYLNFVALLQEFDAVLQLGVEVVGVDPATELDLLELNGRLLLALLFFLLFFFKMILAPFFKISSL